MMSDAYTVSPYAKAGLVSVIYDKFSTHATEEKMQTSLDELKELLRTLQIETLGQFVQKRKTLEAGTLLGKGKLEEIAQEAKNLGINTLVFDLELSASQLRNVQKVTGLDILDRNTIILEIFARHAHTKEAKIQIEISRMEYLLPRLPALWTHFNRQKGGVGVLGGEGEQQIELDRRMIRNRIQHYKKQLEQMIVSRAERQKKRQQKTITAALVGYTNVGKSSLMNRLCQVSLLEENKLFATLDATYRTLSPDSKPPLILIDTVGFISHLPPALIDGFKTTLESANEADLLLVVADISDPNYQEHLQVTLQVLQDLGLGEKEKFFIFNKKDLIKNELQTRIALKKYPNSFLVSSFSSEDILELRKKIMHYFLQQQPFYDLFIPYQDGKSHGVVKSQTNVLTFTSHEQGIFYRVQVPHFIFEGLQIKKYVLQPDDPQNPFALKDGV